MMTAQLFLLAVKVFNQNQEIVLTEKIGAGAEGSVYRLQGRDDVCIKIFSEKSLTALNDSLPKINQLIHLSHELIDDAALPQFLVSTRPNGPIIGFGMQLIAGYEVHNLYGVASRRKYFPHADYRFLLKVAENACISADRIHKNKLIIGDLSGKNLMVRKNAKVCWIDPDSFLIGNPTYNEIGRLITPEWTPPELQNNKHSFTPRTPGHDLFGLAILVFHLVMLGRHPFQGIFTEEGNAPDLSTNISNRWYAHAGLSAIPLKPPVGTPHISHVGPQLEELFYKAFFATRAEDRPSAKTWANAINHSINNLTCCHKRKGHYYSRHVSQCPWCSILAYYGKKDVFPEFFDQTQFVKPSTAKATSLHEVVRLFIEELNPDQIKSMNIFNPSIQLIPPTWNYQPAGFIARIFISKDSEIKKLKHLAQSFNLRKNGIDARISTNIKQQIFYQNEVEKLRIQLAEVKQNAELLFTHSNLKEKASDEIKKKAIEGQKNIYLSRFIIPSSGIPGIGEKRWIDLKSRNIITAADISQSSVMNVYGIGDHLASSLLKWRREKEKNFIPSHIHIDDTELNNSMINYFQKNKITFYKKKASIWTKYEEFKSHQNNYAKDAEKLQLELSEIHANISKLNEVLNSLMRD
jgi:DNA-binding helix-hairpin-helix protein with protein kinase domain